MASLVQISNQDLQWFLGRVESGEIDSNFKNAELVRMERIRLITGSAPRQVRNELNAAVKAGILCRAKKDGELPEAYFHPDWEWRLNGFRNQYARDRDRAIAEALMGCLAIKKLEDD